jgi:hypothetical protein
MGKCERDGGAVNPNVIGSLGVVVTPRGGQIAPSSDGKRNTSRRWCAQMIRIADERFTFTVS